MILFRKKAVRELEGIIEELKINLANNYKEPAHRARVALGERSEALYREGKLTGKEYRKYHGLYESYTRALVDYHH